MGKVSDLVKQYDTSKMSVEELDAFIHEKLAPAMKEEWGEYEIYRNSDGDIVYAPYCDECGGLSDEKSVWVILSEEAADDPDIEDIVVTEETDYLSKMNYLDWCSCNDEEEEDED